ncbi:MAG: phosphate ABC transporter ATP-binding protein [Acidimicrobiia bacterium]|nr:phosphate ABC transporter ATP-binding protein [Acidimicrobiia bacterium]
MTPAYELTGVQHFYGSRCVVDVPALQVHGGEILGIVGPSGAGKSTLLRLLNFLEAPTRGRLAYNGADIGPEVPLELRREVVTVFQQPVLLRRSVMANIRIGQRIRGTADPDGEAEAWLQRLGLAGLARATARTLSAGEAQRVALARALVVRPAVVLLDEPTGNLDPYNVRLIEEIVKADNAERGTTVLLVTHDPFQAKRLAHRTALMIGGKIVEIAETAAFFAAPQQRETAAFLNGELVGAGPPPESAPARRRLRKRRPVVGR